MKVSTIYQKSIKQHAKNGLLKKGSSNKKLGFKITSKKWKGKRMYSLTLVERETCPTTCHHWDDCYGNNMPFAHRFKNKNIDLLLEREIESLMLKHKEGIVIRLHVLGDFYSCEYVNFWEEMLIEHPKLCLFGYTARKEEAGETQSNSQTPFQEDWSYAAEESFTGKSFDCPEQTGALKDCASCGLCWTTPKTVRFISH